MTGTDAKVRLLCLPPSGGQAGDFQAWQRWAPGWMEIVGVDPPGRGTLEASWPIPHLETLAVALGRKIRKDDHPRTALLGCSLGGLVAFEIARYLSHHGSPPLHLVVCSSRAPEQEQGEHIRGLPDDEFIRAFFSRIGIDAADLAEAGCGAVSHRALRADVTASETYNMPLTQPLACSISVFGGLQDVRLSKRDLADWSLRTSSRFSLEMCPGRHLFFREDPARLVRRVSRELQASLDETHQT